MIPAKTLVAALALIAPARADHLRFLEGGSADVPSRREGAEIVLDTAMGALRFPASDFAEVVPVPDPLRDWPSRRDEARRTERADDRIAAALWALDHGLVWEAADEVRRVASEHPEHPVAARMLAALRRLEAPSADPDLAAILRSAPPGHRVHRGPHVLLVHQSPHAEAAERAAHLEAITTAYYLHFASLGIDLAAPRTRLASLWFARKDDYLDFLKSEGAGGFLGTRGYHVPARGVVALYDCRNNPPRGRALAALASRRDELRQARRRLDPAPETARLQLHLAGESPRTLSRAEGLAFVAGLSRRVDRQEMVLELSRREIDLGVAAHETIHQLVESSGLAPRPGAFPHWLSEGLAMQYEPLRAGRWAGLAAPSPLRLRDFRRLPGPPQLEPILRDARLGRGYDRDAYALAWSFTRFLVVDRPAGFVALLDALRLPDPGDSSPADRAFRALSPPEGRTTIEALESDWRRSMQALSAESPAAPAPAGLD